MANFRRKKPRHRTHTHVSERHHPPGYEFMRHHPRWHDILYHNRPRRRRDQRTLDDVLKGRVDPDGAVWETGNSRPHVYYW